MRRRRHNHRRGKNKSVRDIVLCSFAMLFLLATGYSAFSTNITLSAKGNIKRMSASELLKSKVITSGDGIYKDIYEDNRYVFRGEKPNNYLEYNNKLWRIVSLESDGTIKITTDDIYNDVAFDSNNRRSGENNSYCNYTSTNGCNAWSKVDGILTNGSSSGTVMEDSEINEHLNNSFYNSISENDKSFIQYHSFNVGSVSYAEFGQQIVEEKQTIWNGNIGLLSIGDLFKASNYSSCTSHINDTCHASVSERSHDKYPCSHDNYLYIENKHQYTLSAYNRHSQQLIIMAITGCIGVASANNIGNVYYRPTLYLKSDIYFSGKGEKDNPYKIS